MVIVVLYVVLLKTSVKEPPCSVTVLELREYVTCAATSSPSVQVNVSPVLIS
jgi:hypothetical protein